MGLAGAIDITFDFRSDTAPGRDPDAVSPTLRKYHQLLWSKPLPSGAPFELDATFPHTYLHHLSELGEFFLSSDAGRFQPVSARSSLSLAAGVFQLSVWRGRMLS